ncbi:MAG: polysaccharide deacetylase family protein [Paludibacteraceae bacterium]|nr:polysaccharide deacetylase family protein [Paludibacteraceae bacterium]
MFIEQPPAIFRWIFRDAVCRKNSSEKVVYLTFDDGPCAKTTPHILDVLDTFNIKATFFCVGENVLRTPDLFAEIKQRGHAVGNHTMCHANGFKYTTDEYIRLVDEADTLIKSPFFRPPYGRIKPAQYKQLKKRYRFVMWDVITRDYNANLKPEKIVAIVKRYVRNGSVIVFHDSIKAQKNVFAALPQAIEYLQKEGYRFELIK